MAVNLALKIKATIKYKIIFDRHENKMFES